MAQELVTQGATTLHSERRGIGLSFRAPQGAVPSAGVTLDPRRSLAVTEQAIVSTFTLKQVMDQLVAQSGVPGLTSLQLFRQLWDTQNPKPGLGLGGHCNDQVDGSGNPAFNGYPYLCRPAEGSQVQVDPFADPNSGNAYMAVGLFNRFDLAPVDGADCGEYRMVFAKRSGSSSSANRNFIIFEASLPNPAPAKGLEGCLAVARFWKDLSANGDLASRAAALQQFYFQGLPGFRPVVHVDNYGAEAGRGTGQIRTNMFMQSNWMLREFKLQKTCGGTGCTSLKAVAVTDKVNPFGNLFSPTSTHPLAADFRAFLPGQVAALAVADLNLFNYEVSDRFNGGQSQAQGSENNYSVQFGSGGTLRSALQTELTRIGSPLTPDHIIQRAKALSCAGCHDLSNGANVGLPQTWPRSLGFTHTSETAEAGPEGTRFLLSPAVVNVFLPHRAAVLEAFLNRPRPCLTMGCIAAGSYHSLVVRPDGTVRASGENSYGQLGNGSTTSTSTPVQVSGLSGVVAVAAGYGHSLALRTDGTVWAWGNNYEGQLGDGTMLRRTTPVQVSGLTAVTAVAAGGSTSVALRADGSVWAWGSNSQGQLGDGSMNSRSLPGLVSGLNGVTSVAIGLGHVLALRSDKTLWAWGRNDSGQMGDGTTTRRPTALPVPGMTDVVALGASSSSSVVVRSDGTVWAWGSRFTHQGTSGGWNSVFDKSPVRVAGLMGAVTVAAGGTSALVLRLDGSLWSWGLNNSGQLGAGNRQGATVPQPVSGPPGGFVSVSVGENHVLAMRADGSVWSWGENRQGQRGDGTTSARATPGQVPGMDSIMAVSAGANHVLAQDFDGTVWAMGDNSVGQLGLDDPAPRSALTRLEGLSNVGAISAGGYHSLAMLYDGTVWTWGDDEYGQLGLGGTGQRRVPTQVPGLDGIIAVAAGDNHSLALRYDGTVWAWGSNWAGELGIGSTNWQYRPIQVPGLSGIVAIAGGADFSLALHYDGSVWAWGGNWEGELGDGTTEQRNRPIRVPGVSNVVSLDAGERHVLAVRSDGTLWAWGSNGSGELGLGDTVTSHPPAQVTGLSGVVAVSAGSHHSIAVRSDGTVWTWGSNSEGALGIGTLVSSAVPVRVPNLSGIQSVASGLSTRQFEVYSLALGYDGTLWSWGANTDGQLGLDGPTRYSCVPASTPLF
ncbi:RCC1-like domain-containing protein [Corallococcus exercitus]|uniref:RCC1-like domain-containing protein n=1 Tax=Corallococcus exercitus TaxID=2316736 RepID=UPI00300D828F